MTSTLYLWSRGGEPVSLPQDIGFPVGGDTRHQHLVLQVAAVRCVTMGSVPSLQVHYINVELLAREGDTSGVDISYTDTPLPRHHNQTSSIQTSDLISQNNHPYITPQITSQ